MDENKLKAFLGSVFGTYSVRTIELAKDLDGKQTGFNVTFDKDTPVNFDTLSTVSEALGTRDINFGSEERSGGYCDTCAYSYTVTVVRIRAITKELP